MYDSAGRVVKDPTGEYIYDSNGKQLELRDDIKYTFDANGRLVKMVRTYTDGDVYTAEYSYDSVGRVVQEVITNTDGKVSTYKYSYDSVGRVVQEVITNTAGKVSTYKYSYDSAGRVVQDRTAEYIYDSNGKQLELDDYIKYTFDANGRVVKIVDTFLTDETTEYRYDRFGNLKEKTFYGEERYRLVYEYEGMRVFYIP